MEYTTSNKQSAVPTENDVFSIFVVDDDEAFLHALAFHLKKDTGWKVYCYSSAEECLTYLDLNPGAIILDYFFNAPGKDIIDGMTALRVIKTLKPEIPVIMLSSQHNLDVSMELLRHGAFTYIVKDKQTLPAIEKTLLALRSAGARNKAS
jgi:two-component system, NtrC family, response regulator AtoC